MISQKYPCLNQLSIRSNSMNNLLKKASLPLPVQDIIANADISDFVNACLKVTRIGTPSTRPNRNIEVVTAKVADNTGTIDLDLWVNNISTMKKGQVYLGTSVQVRHWMGKKKNFSTVFTSVFTLDSKEDIQAVEVKHDEKDKATIINIPRIHSIEKVEVFLKCVKCSRKFIQPTATAIVHCDRCGYFMRSGDGEKCLYATIVVNPEDGRSLYLTVFNEVLQKVVEDLPTAADSTVCEPLLFLDNITVTYDHNSLVVSVINTQQ